MNRKIKIPKWALICACALLSIFFIGVGVFMIDKLTDWEFKTLNEDNLIKVDNYTIVDDKNADIAIDVKDDGQIAVKGKNKTETDAEKAIVAITLEKGDYYISSGDKKTSSTTYYLVLRDTEGGEIIADDDFTVTESTNYTLYIVVKPGVEIDTTFAPVLVKGDKAGSFYQYNIFNN